MGVHLEPPKGHLPKDVARSPGELPSPVRGQARRAADQLLAYLEGNLTRFSIRWTLPGDCTPFRKGVLETLSRIPFGEVLGYGELASRAGWAGAARAVGQVMATNPLPLVIPCHRVVAAGGGLGGFTGGIAIKRALLAHEGISLGE